MISSAKKLFLRMSFRDLIFPAVRILIILLFLISLALSLKFLYKVINEALIIKPTVVQRPFFDIEKFKRVTSQWGISIED